MKENKEIEQAKITLRELSEEEENQRIAELREKHILDTQDIYETGIEKGIALGKKEEKIYNVPIYVDTIKEGYPILCA